MYLQPHGLWFMPSLGVSSPCTTPLRQWGFRQCLPFSWTKPRGKHCRHPIAVIGVVDTFKPCSGKSLISIFATDYIQKRRSQALLFSFEYNLLPNLISILTTTWIRRKIIGIFWNRKKSYHRGTQPLWFSTKIFRI